MSLNWIAPSLLSCDFAQLKNEMDLVSQAGADLLHVDVMDGHFVPNLTIGMPVVAAMNKVKTKPLDVHLMIEKPERYVDQFIKAGADYLTLHVESTAFLKETINSIRQQNVKAGVTLRPGTSIDQIKSVLSIVDLVLVMTVEPGFGGQSFRHDQVDKVKWLKEYRDQNHLSYLIEVDGGINAETALICWQAGADILVAGSSVFKGAKSVESYRQNIQDLKSKK